MKKVNDDVVAVYSMGLQSVCVLAIEYGIDDTIVWRWSGETRKHRSKVRYTDDVPRFRAGGHMIPLNECIRVNL